MIYPSQLPPYRLTRKPPFYIRIGYRQPVMQVLEARVKTLVNLGLPVFGGRVAEEDAASHGPDKMHPANFAGLEGAPPRSRTWLRPRSRRQGLQIGQFGRECRQFGCRDVQAVAILIESATPPRHHAQGLPPIDLQLQIGV